MTRVDRLSAVLLVTFFPKWSNPLKAIFLKSGHELFNIYDAHENVFCLKLGNFKMQLFWFELPVGMWSSKLELELGLLSNLKLEEKLELARKNFPEIRKYSNSKLQNKIWARNLTLPANFFKYRWHFKDWKK